MMRILLFLATNAAVLVLISVVFQVLGIEGILAENGVDLNLQALLLMSAVIGFGGSFISLAMSKFMAKRSMGVQIIERPGNSTEQWLVVSACRKSVFFNHRIQTPLQPVCVATMHWWRSAADCYKV